MSLSYLTTKCDGKYERKTVTLKVRGALVSMNNIRWSRYVQILPPSFPVGDSRTQSISRPTPVLDTVQVVKVITIFMYGLKISCAMHLLLVLKNILMALVYPYRVDEIL